VEAFSFVARLLRCLDPERAHALTLWVLRRGLVAPRQAPDDPILRSRVWGRDFDNPLGLAAGFDKNAAVMGPMLAMGFGFVEVGSVTPRPQPGNPKPRIFRLAEDEAVINRLGFNNQGSSAAAESLAAWRAGGGKGIVGVNLGKNKDSDDAAGDYATGARRLCGDADYLVVNVSSPNTPGLRALQGRAQLEEILGGLKRTLEDAGSRVPLVLKIAPDLTEEDKQDIAAVALDMALDGLIVSNTTIERPAGLKGRHRGETGGLSGRPLFDLSSAVLADMFRLTQGRVTLIGVGGVAGGAQAYAKIRAGASLVQIYSALIYQGPGLVPRIKRELAALLRRDGFNSLSAAVGADHR
jgi:dihydroorotate dehydrogenase